MDELRDFQQSALECLRLSYATGHRVPLLVMPTAAGKTIVFRETARLAQTKGNRTLVVVHRRELVNQASAKLTEAGVAHGIVAAAFEPAPDATVQVASIQTAVRRDIGAFGYIIADEAHHAVAVTWKTVLAAQPKAVLLGCTATPSRLDGKGLGSDHGGVLDDLTVGATVRELTEAGWLAPAKVFVAETKLNLRSMRIVAGDYARGELASAVMAADIAGDAVSYRAFMSEPRTRREFEIYRRARGYKKGWVFYARQQQAEQFGGGAR
jgi:superfamily II DNA or RNA helicase